MYLMSLMGIEARPDHSKKPGARNNQSDQTTLSQPGCSMRRRDRKCQKPNRV